MKRLLIVVTLLATLLPRAVDARVVRLVITEPTSVWWARRTWKWTRAIR